MKSKQMSDQEEQAWEDLRADGGLPESHVPPPGVTQAQRETLEIVCDGFTRHSGGVQLRSPIADAIDALLRDHARLQEERKKIARDAQKCLDDWSLDASWANEAALIFEKWAALVTEEGQ